jgi:hypothetical protein
MQEYRNVTKEENGSNVSEHEHGDKGVKGTGTKVNGYMGKIPLFSTGKSLEEVLKSFTRMRSQKERKGQNQKK